MIVDRKMTCVINRKIGFFNDDLESERKQDKRKNGTFRTHLANSIKVIPQPKSAQKHNTLYSTYHFKLFSILLI